MIEEGIVALLRADATLTGLIGTRLYPVLVPEPTVYPCLSYQVVSASPDYTIDGTRCGSKRIQFDAWGTSYGDCKAILQALGNVLDLFRGMLPDGTRALVIRNVLELDQFESDGRVYRSLADYRAEYAETP